MKMKRLVTKTAAIFLFAVFFGLYCFPSTALASNYIYKWYQPYDLPNGIDIESSFNNLPGTAGIYHVLADDWLCVDNRPVTDIHWWGSYWEIDAAGALVPYTGETDPYRVMNTSPQFMVEIWTDVPVDPRNPNSFSHPGECIWQKPTAFPGGFIGHEQNPDMGDASKFGWNWGLDQKDWFRQDPDSENVYWLSIYQIFGEEDQYLWGWETSEVSWIDDAVVWNGEFYEPVGQEVGLAFGITTVPVPGAVWLLGSGLLGLMAVRRRKKG